MGRGARRKSCVYTYACILFRYITILFVMRSVFAVSVCLSEERNRCRNRVRHTTHCASILPYMYIHCCARARRETIAATLARKDDDSRLCRNAAKSYMFNFNAKRHEKFCNSITCICTHLRARARAFFIYTLSHTRSLSLSRLYSLEDAHTHTHTTYTCMYI